MSIDRHADRRQQCVFLALDLAAAHEDAVFTIGAQQQGNGGNCSHEGGAAVAHERQRQTLRGKESRGNARVDNHLNADPDAHALGDKP